MKRNAANKQIYLLIEKYAKSIGVTLEVFIGPGRSKELSSKRRECMLELRRYGLSYPLIGKVLNRNHSTVIYSIKKMEGNCHEREKTNSNAELKNAS